MTEKPIAKPLFVVIYPYKFTDFLYDLMELPYFKRYCDVLVLDVSPLTAWKFSQGISASRSTRTEVVATISWREFVRQIRKLRARSEVERVCIQNVAPHSSISGLLCNLILTAVLINANVVVFDLYISGTPVYHPGSSAEPESHSRLSRLVGNMRRFVRHTTTLAEARRKISRAMFDSFTRWVPSMTTHRLVAGDDWEALARTTGPARNRVKLVYGHSHDFSNNLLFEATTKPSPPASKRLAVLLDAAGPKFGDDYIYLGRKVFLTANVWYPLISNFLDRLEDELEVKFEIAGHPKSTHPAIAPYFGNRRVHYGITRELVRESEFVVTRQSAAIAYAVMFRKPIVFIYSNQIKEDLRAMRGIFQLARLLGREPININEPPRDVRKLLTVDENIYRRFERACLTSGRCQRPNSRIILEELMNIKPGPEFYKSSEFGTAA